MGSDRETQRRKELLQAAHEKLKTNDCTIEELKSAQQDNATTEEGSARRRDRVSIDDHEARGSNLASRSAELRLQARIDEVFLQAEAALRDRDKITLQNE
eukprot:7633139-Pyramimonas_sp.AAC.1